MDTGTSIIVGPNNRVGPLIDAVNKSTGYMIAADGTMDCELEAKVPTLGFVIDVRQSYSISRASPMSMDRLSRMCLCTCGAGNDLLPRAEVVHSEGPN